MGRVQKEAKGILLDVLVFDLVLVLPQFDRCDLLQGQKSSIRLLLKGVELLQHTTWKDLPHDCFITHFRFALFAVVKAYICYPYIW